MYCNELKEFVKYFINLKKLKFNYVNGSFSIGMSFIEFIVLISNEFIKWYNDRFNKGEVLFRYPPIIIMRDSIIIIHINTSF